VCAAGMVAEKGKKLQTGGGHCTQNVNEQNIMLINSTMGLFHMQCGLLKMKGCNDVV